MTTKRKDLLILNWPLIEKQMKRKHITQIKLAELMGISRTAISSWKSNQYSPSDARITELCKLLDINEDFILVTSPGSLQGTRGNILQTEYLSAMLALSKLEDLIVTDTRVYLSKEDESDAMEIAEAAKKLRQKILKSYNKKEDF